MLACAAAVLVAYAGQRGRAAWHGMMYVCMRECGPLGLRLSSHGCVYVYVQVLGATTLNEHRKYIERDAALERRFQPVMVGEPNEEQTLSILMVRGR